MLFGIGFRAEMRQWDMSHFDVDFYEVVPENWVRRDLSPLIDLGKPIRFHGVSLNLGGAAPINKEFLLSVRDTMKALDIKHYSDHLASSGDAHQLYDLFPVPFTKASADHMVSNIQQAQDILGMQMAVENSAYYTNVGDMDEVQWLCDVIKRSGAKLLLDTNNIRCNQKNHGSQFMRGDMMDKLAIKELPISYCHVAAHEWSERFKLYWDTHAGEPERDTLELAKDLGNQEYLLEWDNDLPSEQEFKEVVCRVRNSLNT